MIGTKTRPPFQLSVAACAFIAVCLLVGECISLESRTSGAPLQVSVVSISKGAEFLNVTFKLTAEEGSIDAHLALVPGESVPHVNQVFIFYDPSFFIRFGNTVDIVGLQERLSDYLSEFSPSIPVSLVDASQLPSALLANPHAALIDFCYAIIPGNIFSKNTTLLKTWLDNGGTLIWAGGPIAFFEDAPSPTGGLLYEDLGWAGQVDLVGYDLEDPIGNPAVRSSGPLLGTMESPAGKALGISFAGTPDGANVSRLESHGGTDLGFDTASGGNLSDRTSLAYVPMDQGRLFFFGGAMWGDQVGLIPNAAGYLASDIELLMETSYAPLAGPSTYENVSLPYLAPLQVTLRVDTTYSHLVAVIISTAGPVTLFLWSQQVA